MFRQDNTTWTLREQSECVGEKKRKSKRERERKKMHVWEWSRQMNIKVLNNASKDPT